MFALHQYPKGYFWSTFGDVWIEVRVTGYKIQGTECGVKVAGYEMRGAGARFWVIGYWGLRIRLCFPVHDDRKKSFVILNRVQRSEESPLKLFDDMWDDKWRKFLVAVLNPG